MMSLAIAMPSTSSSARSAPKMRSALSALLAQSGGSSCVSVLMMRRFWSAAVVRSEAFHSQSATMMTNERASAVALNAPRPAHRLMGVMVDLYCTSYPALPDAVTLDIDDTVDVVH